jgi:uncharacterized membrane protein YozB (DUF420 family)
MKNGFLGNPTSFMLDFVVCALVVLVPLLLYSLFVVKKQKNYTLHKKLQVTLGIILLVAVGAFEIDMQWVQGGWENVMAKQLDTLGEEGLAKKIDSVRTVLHIHLIFAIATPVLWIVTLVLALKRFEQPPIPGSHSTAHKTLGWASTIALTLTSVTGIWFYVVAFVG